MERNQNGYPTSPRCDCERQSHGGCGSSERASEMSACEAFDTMPIAYCYVPRQKFRMLYNESDALSHGTLFEELYIPTEVYAK